MQNHVRTKVHVHLALMVCTLVVVNLATAAMIAKKVCNLFNYFIYKIPFLHVFIHMNTV